MLCWQLQVSPVAGEKTQLVTSWQLRLMSKHFPWQFQGICGMDQCSPLDPGASMQTTKTSRDRHWFHENMAEWHTLMKSYEQTRTNSVIAFYYRWEHVHTFSTMKPDRPRMTETKSRKHNITVLHSTTSAKGAHVWANLAQTQIYLEPTRQVWPLHKTRRQCAFRAC